MIEQELDFLGTGWSFPPRFGGDKRLFMAEGAQDIAESLRILLATRCGERVMQPAYGTRLHQMVFEAGTLQNLSLIKEMLRKAVLFYEPRVALESVDAQIAADDMACLQLQLDYRIRSTNTRHNLVFPLYLDQASNPVRAG